MKPTSKRKAIWICVAIVLGSYVARNIIRARMQMAYYQQAMAAAPRQKATRAATPSPALHQRRLPP